MHSSGVMALLVKKNPVRARWVAALPSQQSLETQSLGTREGVANSLVLTKRSSVREPPQFSFLLPAQRTLQRSIWLSSVVLLAPLRIAWSQ
jgi:hypothetical protein